MSTKNPLPLRFANAGPKIGTPPVLATPNLLSLIACVIGDPVLTDFDTVATKSVEWNGGGTGLPVDLKVGYRYTIFAQVSVEETGLTLSHLFLPRWNRRVKATSAWVYPVGSEQLIQTNQVISSGNNHVNAVGDQDTNAMVVCVDEFIPTQEYDAISIALSSKDGVLPTAFIRNANCWVAVLERAGNP
jgi:hypothetical protein